jgi:phenylpropionate dioxygenase-like ring-hydroxylating dioxygenase large terminal subunit
MKRDAWHCAGWSRELAAAPIGRKLLGHDVVLFRDANGAAHALGARCPHRGADLARGMVVDGCIQCPFHGWRFDGRGQCVRVPSQPGGLRISPLARVPAYPLHEREGTVWIWMAGGETRGGDPPRDPVAPRGRHGRRLYFDPRLIDAPSANVLENFFDKAHVPFIHTGTFGSKQDPLVARQRITIDADGRGLRAEDDAEAPWRAEPKVPGGFLGVLGRLFFGLRTPVAQHTRFAVDTGVQLYMQYPNRTFDVFLARLTPADEVHTWLFVESVRTRAPHVIGDWIQQRAVRKVFDEGARETGLILDPPTGAETPAVSVESDRLGIAARQLYERWIAAAGTSGMVAPPRGQLASTPSYHTASGTGSSR